MGTRYPAKVTDTSSVSSNPVCQQLWPAMCCSSANRVCSDFSRASFAIRSSRSYSSFGGVPIFRRSSWTAFEKTSVALSYCLNRRPFSSLHRLKNRHACAHAARRQRVCLQVVEYHAVLGRGCTAVYPELDRGRSPPERGWLCCDCPAGRGRDRGGPGEVINDGSFGSQILLRSFARIAF
jgi:hypothetical protein